jgi:hypothetical protein
LMVRTESFGLFLEVGCATFEFAMVFGCEFFFAWFWTSLISPIFRCAASGGNSS